MEEHKLSNGTDVALPLEEGYVYSLWGLFLYYIHYLYIIVIFQTPTRDNNLPASEE